MWARQPTQEALDWRKEMERLYSLSRGILLTDARQEPAEQTAERLAREVMLACDEYAFWPLFT